MIDYNIEFTKGVLFIRLFGILNRINQKNIEFDLLEVIREGGIRYLVFNIEDLEIDDNVTLFSDCEKVIKDNDGRMLLCGNSEICINDFEIVDDELSALKAFSVC